LIAIFLSKAAVAAAERHRFLKECPTLKICFLTFSESLETSATVTGSKSSGVGKE